MKHQVINNPPENWMECLRRDHWVWLVKEQQPASVEFPYEAPEPGYKTGRIGIRRFSINNEYLDTQSCFININGEGINGSQLMLPTEGNLPDNPELLPEPIVRQVQRTLEHLDQRISILERGADPFWGYLPMKRSWWDELKFKMNSFINSII